MLPRGHLHLTETLKYCQRGEPRITWPSIVATPVSRSVFADPARLISIIRFCADAGVIGCADCCLRKFPLAIRSGATI